MNLRPPAFAGNDEEREAPPLHGIKRVALQYWAVFAPV